MSEAEITDSDPAVGLGCALESFTEFEEVKGNQFQQHISIPHSVFYLGRRTRT